MRPGNDAAFPTGTHKALGEIAMGQVTGGLTKRELIAAMILQGLYSNLGHPDNSLFSAKTARENRAKESVLAADALLKELAK